MSKNEKVYPVNLTEEEITVIKNALGIYMKEFRGLITEKIPKEYSYSPEEETLQQTANSLYQKVSETVSEIRKKLRKTTD